MEADTERVGGLPRRHQQFGDLVGLGAELGGEAELRMVRRDAQAHEQVQILRAFGRADDLFELVERVERESAHAMLPISFGNRFLGLHRVHEAERRLRQRARNEADLGDRRDVIMGDTRIPQHAQQVGRRIRLDRIHGRAGKSLDEETRCAPRGMRADKRNRFDRRKCLNQPVGAMMLVQLKGPPKITLNIQGCLAVIGSPPGAAGCAYMAGGLPCKDPPSQFCNAMVTGEVEPGPIRVKPRRAAQCETSTRQGFVVALETAHSQSRKGPPRHGVSRRRES